MKTAILCVDDELVILHSLEMQLREHFGNLHVLEFAETAEEALEVLEELRDQNVKVLAIVSDWLMPGMKGDEFLIEAHQRFPHIVMIMLTGHADEVAIKRVENHVDSFECLTKPWDSGVLVNTLDNSLTKFDE